MSRDVLTGPRPSLKCGDRKLEGVGHGCNDLNTSIVAKYTMKPLHTVESMLTRELDSLGPWQGWR